MPFNIFGEEFVDRCPCTGCRRMQVNRDYIDGANYVTAREAERARNTYIRENGDSPPSNYTPGTSFHTVPVRQPEFTSMVRTHNGTLWSEVHSRGPLDDAGLRELRDLTNIHAQGGVWQAHRPPRPPSPAEQRLRGFPQLDPRKNYSWRPRQWIFHGEGPAFYGLEIEIRANDYRPMQLAQQRVGPLGHLKNDSSIGGGFELVTHPMDYPWAMEHFPWDLLPELESVGCTIEPSVNGIHTHVSRTAFQSQAHMLRFLKFIYRNKPQVIRLARRRTDRYGSFSEAVQRGQLTHVKAEKAREKQQAAQERYRECPCFTHETEYAEATRDLEALLRGDITRANRYQAVNTRNLETLELRVFASTLAEFEAKVSLQFPASVVAYTQKIRAADVCQGAWRWSRYSEWLREHEAEYPELVRANAHARMPNRPTAKYSLSATPRRGL